MLWRRQPSCQGLTYIPVSGCCSRLPSGHQGRCTARPGQRQICPPLYPRRFLYLMVVSIWYQRAIFVDFFDFAEPKILVISRFFGLLKNRFPLLPLGKSGFNIVPEVRYIPNKGLFSMGNPTNFLCIKGVLYCFGIISVPDSAFLRKILSCTILP